MAGQATIKLDKRQGAPPGSAPLIHLSYRPEARFYIMLLLSLGMYLISASIGSGWVLFLSSGLSCCAIMSILLPALALKSISLEVIGPDQVNAGDQVPLVVKVHVDSLYRPLLNWLILQVVPGSESYAENEGVPVLVEDSRRSSSYAISSPGLRRGIRKLPAVCIETSFPFGIIWCRATFQSNEKIAVLPRVETVEGRFLYRLRSGVYVPGDGQNANAGFQSCCARGVRPYVRGDSRRFIHWSLSARHGRLMVRELEQEGLPVYDLAFDVHAQWKNLEQFELGISVAASILQLGHSLGIHPDLFVLEKLLESGDELKLRSVDIDQQLLWLASLEFNSRRQNSPALAQSDPEAFANRTRAVILVTPQIEAESAGGGVEESRTRSSVFVIRIAPGKVQEMTSVNGNALVFSKKEDFTVL